MAPIPKPAAPALPAPHSPAPAPPTPTSFPTASCGPHISAAIAAVSARTQAAPELVAHHLLTLAAMAAQRLINVRLPTGAVQPVSTYFLTIAGSGEGRSAAENMCVGPVRFWQQRFAGKDVTRDEKGRRLVPRTHITYTLDVPTPENPTPEVQTMTFLGPADDADPAAPPKPFEVDEVFLTLRRPGIKDRYDRYARFGRRSGLFAAVAPDLLTPSSARRNEAGSLSAVWDGNAGVSGGDGDAAPRLSVHLVAALSEGLALLRAPEVADSGLLGRLLAVQPASRIGTRAFSEGDGTPPACLAGLHERLTDLYARPAPFTPRVVAMGAEARIAWLAFAREIEAKMAPEGELAPIRALGGRLAEHAARLAAVIALLDDPELTSVSAAMLERGIALARFYADEALRLSRLRGPARAEIDPLAALQDWLERKFAGAEVTLREVYCHGPACMRSATIALRAMRQLELLGVTEALKSEGANSRTTRWRVSAREAGASQHNAA